MPDLLKFYITTVNKDLKKYIGDPYHSRPLLVIDSLSDKIGIIKKEEKSSSPFLSLKDYKPELIKLNGISFLLTSNPRLCMLNVYHKLKKDFLFHMEEKCLFIDLKDFREYYDEIKKLSQCKFFHCLVLLWQEVDTGINDFKDRFDELKKKEVIVIANVKCKQLLQDLQSNVKNIRNSVLHYEWKDLKKKFQDKMRDKKVIYQGIETYLTYVIDEAVESEIINSEVLSYLMEEKNVIIGPEYTEKSLLESKSLYISRRFHPENGDYSLRYSTKHTDVNDLMIESLDEEDLAKKILKQRVVIVADGPGTGKSTVITSLMDTVKQKCPSFESCPIKKIFLGRINLSDHAQEASLFQMKSSSSTIDVLKYFYDILGIETCLERRLVDKLKNMKEWPSVIMFDSFDEVVPQFKEAALKLIRTLIKETEIHMCIFTRAREKSILEKEMNAFSLSLCPFTIDDQVEYLEKFLRYKLDSLKIYNEDDRIQCEERIKALSDRLKGLEKEKKEEKLSDTIKKLDGLVKAVQSKTIPSEEPRIKHGMKINELDFKSYSKSLLGKINGDISGKSELFTTLPLHLYMIAEIIYNENFEVKSSIRISNENFEVSSRNWGFDLYFYFLETIVKKHLREKCQMKRKAKDPTLVFDVVKEVILSSLTTILGNVLSQNKQSSLSTYDKNCLEIVQRIGLVSEREPIRFIHMSIQEFVFFGLIREKIMKNTLDPEQFKELLSTERYIKTVEYLDIFFERGEADNVNFSSSFLINFNVNKEFIANMKNCERNKKCYTFNNINIWRKIVSNYREVYEKGEAESLPPRIADHLQKSWQYRSGRFEFLTKCLNDEMFNEIFDKYATKTAASVYSILGKGSLKEVQDVIKMLEMILKTKTPQELNLFNFKLNHFPNRNIFHWASTNKDGTAFYKLLQFAKKFMDEKTLLKMLTQGDCSNFTVLHYSILAGPSNILTILRDLEENLQKHDFLFLLSPKKNKAYSFLSQAARRNSSDSTYKSLIEYLTKVMDRKALKELFLQLDPEESSILNFAAGNAEKEIFKVTSERICTYIQDEKLENFICTKSSHMRSIFHARSEHSYQLKDLDTDVKYMKKEKFAELLTAVDQNEQTCAHIMCKAHTPINVLCSNLCFFAEKLDEESLEKFLVTQDKCKNTFLHVLADKFKGKEMTTFHSTLDSTLSDSLFKEILNKANEEGEIVEIVRKEGTISFKKSLKKSH